ncbi:MAG: hypothetical protein WCK06_01815 [Actinomycetota bacterium]
MFCSIDNQTTPSSSTNSPGGRLKRLAEKAFERSITRPRQTDLVAQAWAHPHRRPLYRRDRRRPGSVPATPALCLIPMNRPTPVSRTAVRLLSVAHTASQAHSAEQ